MTTTLILDRICPYAHRARITIQEKKVPYTLREVSLQNKEPYFTETYHKAFGHDPSSNGKVPILIDGDKTLTESDLISWYLAENYQTGTNLIPNDAFDKLRLRHFAQTHGKISGATFGFFGFGKKSQQEKDKVVENLTSVIGQLDKALTLPYALGNDFTLADILIYPWFERLPIFEKLAGVDVFSKFGRAQEWIKNVQGRESIKNIRGSQEYYVESLKSIV